MRIPLPKMMRHWREDQFQKKLTPPTARYGLAFWVFLAKRPGLYHFGMRIAMAALGVLGRTKGRFRWLPLAEGWTFSRDMPAPTGRTFQAQWKKTRRQA